MALKDLVAKKAALTEEAIEAIVGNYIRYDEETLEIAFTPAAARLSNKRRVLVYLVALQGWAFVTDKPVASDARPIELEAALGIRGNSLRPILKELTEAHLIAARDGRYFAAITGLEAIRAIVGAEAA